MINNMFALGMPSGTELMILLLIVLLLFGAKRLPELAKGMGKSIREFKKATSEVEDDIREALKDEPVKKKEDSAVNTEAAAPKTPSEDKE